jgi:hypothetical protein
VEPRLSDDSGLVDDAHALFAEVSDANLIAAASTSKSVDDPG